jgi:hypothetical protein
MMTPTDVLGYLKAVPFKPFRIHMASGQTFEVGHPELMRVGTTFAIFFTYVADDPELFDRWETISLMLIEHISLLDVVAEQS